jgi:hypothetical protein
MKFGKAKNPVERHLDGASKAKHTNGTPTASQPGVNLGLVEAHDLGAHPDGLREIWLKHPAVDGRAVHP